MASFERPVTRSWRKGFRVCRRSRRRREPPASLLPRSSSRTERQPRRSTNRPGSKVADRSDAGRLDPVSRRASRAGAPGRVGGYCLGGYDRQPISPETGEFDPPPAPFEEAEAFEFAAFEPAREEPLRESFPPPPEEGFDQVLAATNRDATAGAVLAALVRRFPSAAIFSSRSEGVTGWDAAGKDVNPSALRSFSVSWNEPSVFLTARISRDFYVGPLPSLPRHDQLAAALGGWPREGIVLPVFIGEKPVAFLYASSPSPGAFSAWDLAFIRRLCDAASTAFANAIRLKKGEI